MATPSAPNNFYVQQGNRQVFLSWDISAGADAYVIQRSTDNVTFSTLDISLVNNYLDTTASVGVQYWYKVAGASGSSAITGTIVSSTMNVITITAANLAVGKKVYGLNVLDGTVITSFGTGVGGTGSYIISINQQISNPQSMLVTSGIGNYTASQSTIPAPTAEMSLGQIRLLAQQRADRVNSNFVTMPEWNSYINQSMYELYDMLITADEEYYVATPISWVSDGTTFQYDLPNGALTFTNGIDGTTPIVAAPFYKLKGVDLGLNTAQNAYVTINKFNFIDRNRFVYPNTASTIYGVFNLQYRLLGDKIEFIPTPSAGQRLRMWYIPRLPQLLKDTDLTTSSISGWIEYVIVDAAIKALQKEESDVSVLMAQKQMLKQRIEETAVNRDTGMPDKVSDVRQNGYWGSMSGGYGWNGPMGGF